MRSLFDEIRYRNYQEYCTRTIENSFYESNCITERVNYYLPEKGEDLRFKLTRGKQGCIEQNKYATQQDSFQILFYA